MNAVENDVAEQVTQEQENQELQAKLQEAYQNLMQLQQRANGMEQLLIRLHAVAKHGSVRSGALTYIRDELLKAFGEQPQGEPQGDAHKQEEMDLDGGQ